MVREIFVDDAKPSVENMNLDRRNYERAQQFSPKEYLIRLYEWERPCVSLGCSQEEGIVKPEALNEVDVVQRITGGSAVLHYKEITYSVAASHKSEHFGGSLHQSYQKIAKLLTSFLRTMGVDSHISEDRNTDSSEERPTVCFQRSGFGEIVVDGRKLVGSAQKRGLSGFLQHGSIPFHRTKKVLEDCLGSAFLPKRRTDYVYLQECLPSPAMSLREVKEQLAAFLRRELA